MLESANPDNASIVADWGTSRLRVMLCDGNRLADQRNGPGIAATVAARRHPSDVLADVAGDWLDRYGQYGVILCGMVGSNIGWIEAPYIECPVDLSGLATASVRLTTPTANLAIIPGLTCENHLGAPDVMRGEETQILGAMELHAALRQGRHFICLPGTHSKWVELEDGVVRKFTTSPTGEFFAVLTERSVLVQPASAVPQDAAAFDAGVVRSLSTPPASMPFVLFEVRSRMLRGKLSPEASPDFLSGLLIGAEIKAACESVLGTRAKNQEIVLVGDTGMTVRYARALALAHCKTREIDGCAAVFAGLMAMRGAATGNN